MKEPENFPSKSFDMFAMKQWTIRAVKFEFALVFSFLVFDDARTVSSSSYRMDQATLHLDTLL